MTMESSKLELLKKELQELLSTPFVKESENEVQEFTQKLKNDICEMDKSYVTAPSQLAVSMSL